MVGCLHPDNEPTMRKQSDTNRVVRGKCEEEIMETHSLLYIPVYKLSMYLSMRFAGACWSLVG
jgi:hypothetical protein